MAGATHLTGAGNGQILVRRAPVSLHSLNHMTDTQRAVALVTGASRGVGRGIAVALADAGMRVFASGRTIDGTALPAEIVRVACDHTDDEAVTRLFTRVDAECGRLDVLVARQVARGAGRRARRAHPEIAGVAWLATAGVAVVGDAIAIVVRSVAHLAARTMVAARRGLIVNISHWAAQKRIGNTIYGIAKAATDKLTRDTAIELRPHGVTVVSLYPGLVRTEAVLAAGVFDLSNSESPEFSGRAVAALADDPELLTLTGSTLVAAALAQRYGFTDTDGRSPRPLTLDDV